MKRVVIVGGGAAGLAAAYTLGRRGLEPLLLEAGERAGGRLSGEEVGGFSIDTGADFFCSSYDVAFRLCRELGLTLVPSRMRLGWYRGGRWVTTTPGLSPANLLRNLPAARALGLLSPRAAMPAVRLFRGLVAERDHLSFAGGSRLAELDGDEMFGGYLRRIGAPESLRTTLRGFLEMTMGDAEAAGAAYMRTYLAEMIVRADQLRVPERGAGALASALAEACADAVRLSTPVDRVVVANGVATGVAAGGAMVEADAVICAVPATRVPALVPGLPDAARRALEGVTYSSGVRVVIGLDRPPLPPGWHGALYPEDETPLLLDRSVNLPLCAPAGMSTLDLLVGRERARELMSLDDGEIARQLLCAARRNPPPGSDLPADGEGLFVRVYRWREAVCMGPPGMFGAVAQARRQLRSEVSNLFLAGDYTRVPSVNGALASGVGAAEEAADHLLASGAG